MNLLIRTVAVVLLAVQAFAIRSAPDAVELFQQAQDSYAARQYQSALTMMQKAVELDPDNSRYHHLLGKCYGRLAEQSNPLSAFSLAQKTRKALERAVELDEHNVNALHDLMEYYRQAPGFLGGSKEKAEKIEKQLKEFGISAG